MPLPELDNLARIGKLKQELPEQNELAGLLRSGQVRRNAVRHNIRTMSIFRRAKIR